MPTIAPEEDLTGKAVAGAQFLTDKAVAGTQLSSAFGFGLFPTGYAYPTRSDIEGPDEASADFGSVSPESGSISVGVSSESDLVVHEVDGWIRQLERNFSTPTRQLLRWAHREDMPYELDIDVPSMRRFVGRREIHIVARTRRVPKVGFLVEELEIDPEASGDD